jgi:acetyltransferase-like isoleucine patch superfamily enzyme
MVSLATKRRLFAQLVVVLRFLGSLVYDPQYLVGVYFDDSLIGWKWVLRGVLFQKILRFNRNIPWPVSPLHTVSWGRNLTFHPDDINMFNEMSGKYFQNFGARITIGRGSWIASNVGIITANHDPADLAKHLPGEPVTLGESCWIGMNSVILPGVTLGPHTIVGAGSVVTHSFPDGHCVIAGNPARLIRALDEVQAAGEVDGPK